MGLGRSLEAQRRPAEASAEYRQCLALGGVSADVRGGLWRTLQQARLFAELEQALATNLGADEEEVELVRARLLVWRGASDAEWAEWESRAAPAQVDARQEGRAWRCRRRLERYLWHGPLEEAQARCAALEKVVGTGPEVQQWQWCLAVRACKWEEADSLLTARWNGAPAGGRPVGEALLYGLACEWAGRGKEAQAWRRKVEEESGEKGLAGPAAQLRTVAGGQPLATAQGRRAEAPTPLLLLAGALRAADDAERDRFLERAERLAAADMNATVFLIRGFFRRTRPAH
ncbi:MAG: hypothetical protein HYZ53_21730 [Planctomycetes bacterium]|nr:hypothetical protein [Planctomycetota bacterium]